MSSASPRSRPTAPLWVICAAPAAVLTVLVALALSGAVAPTQLADPGVLVRWGRPVVTVLTELAAALTLGGAFLLAFVLPAVSGKKRRGSAWDLVRAVVAAAAPAWTVLLAAQLIFAYAVTAGRPLGAPGFSSELVYYATEVSAGRARGLSVLLAALVSVAAVAIAGPGTAMTTFLLGLGVLIPIASTGHAAGAENHDLGMTGQYLHLLTAALWIGALAVLAIARPRLSGAPLRRAAERFSAAAIWCYAGLVVSGVANAWIRMESPAQLLTTTYGRLLAAKIVLLVALGAFGWWHRRVTVPALPERPRLFWRLAGVELILMGVASGLAVVLASSAPPVSQEPLAAPTPTELISQRPAPPTPSPARWLTEFYPDLAFGTLTVVLLGVYLMWVLRLRRRGDAWPVGRTVTWVLGCLGFGYVNLGGPAVYGHVLFSAHMVAHMSMVMLLPILFASAAPVTLALRALPVRKDGSRGPREWILALVHSRWAGFFANPIVAAVNVVASMVLFYFTPLLGLAMTTHLGHILMVVHFSLVGYLFANALIGVDPGPRRLGYPMRLLLLLGTMAFHAFFGIALISWTALLAPDYYGALGLPWGVDAMLDQRIGGEITWGIGEVPSLALAIIIAVTWSRDEERVARRKDRAADRDGDAELVAYNRMLAGLREDED